MFIVMVAFDKNHQSVSANYRYGHWRTQRGRRL